MTFERVQEYVDKMMALVPEGNIEISEAERLAAKFAVARGNIAKYQLELDLNKNKMEGVVSSTYKHALFEAEGKVVAEKQASAEADPTYLARKQELDDLESKIYYLKIMADLFHNLHIFYRNMGKTYGV